MSDVVRVGYISAVNHAEGTAQVVYKDRDNSLSPFMPLWSNEWNPPEIDTMVYVIHLQNGGTREEKRLDIVSDSVHVESLNIAGDLTVDGAIEAKSIKTTGNVHVGGNLTVDGSYPG